MDREQLVRQLDTLSATKLNLGELIGVTKEKYPFPEIPEEVAQVLAGIKKWCQDHGIWSTSDEQGEAYTSMVAYLHPYFTFTQEGISPESEEFKDYLCRLTVVGKLYSWLFYLDDTFGNDIQQGLPPEGQQVVNQCMRSIFGYLQGQITFATCVEQFETLTKNVSPKLWPYIEKVTRAFGVYQELISEFETCIELDSDADSISPELPKQWLQTMQSNLRDHLLQALVNQDAQPVSTVQEYIEKRRKVSGMVPAVDMIRYITHSYTDSEEEVIHSVNLEFDERSFSKCTSLREKIHLPALSGVDTLVCPLIPNSISLHKAIELLQICCIDYGGLVNDMVSLYKELSEGSFFNLVAVVCSLTDTPEALAIITVMQQVGVLMSLIKEYALVLVDTITTTIDVQLANNQLSDHDKDVLMREKSFTTGLWYAMLATYHWQISPEARARYQKSAEKLYREFN